LERWWDQQNYGGPVTNALKKDKDGETIEVPNRLLDILKEQKDGASEHSGLFKFENQKITNQYVIDLEIFIDAKDQQSYDMLRAAEGNKAVSEYSEIMNLIDGYGRFVRFEPFQKYENGTMDVSNPDQNLILEIFEGLMQAGTISDEPAYGRWFKDGNKCYLGYFMADNSDEWGPRFHGKGIHYQDSVVQHEGIYMNSIDAPFEDREITSFEENETK